MFEPVADLCVEIVEGTLERGGYGAWPGEGSCKPRPEQTVICAREEERHAQSELSDAIAEGVGDALDQAVQA